VVPTAEERTPKNAPRKPLSIPAIISDDSVNVLLDTGSALTLVSSKVAEDVDGAMAPWNGPDVRLADGNTTRPLGIKDIQ
jgi:hypothetical protein